MIEEKLGAGGGHAPIDRSLSVDHNMGCKPWASALGQIIRNALACGLVRLMIDAVL